MRYYIDSKYFDRISQKKGKKRTLFPLFQFRNYDLGGSIDMQSQADRID